MKFRTRLMDERFARPAAGFMRSVCYLVMGFFILCTILGVLGRQTFALHTNQGTFPQAIYAEEDHDPSSRWLTVHMGDDIHVWANGQGEIDWPVPLGLALMYGVNTVPIIFAFWFLSRVFSNIRKGQVFTEENASCLLSYGLLQFFVAVFVPFLKLAICGLTNLISSSRLSVSTGQDALQTLIPSIAFIVAAYIIQYGVHLQDEVDHTL